MLDSWGGPLLAVACGAACRCGSGSGPDATGDPGDPATLTALLTHALTPAADSRSGVSVYFSFVAASVSDPGIARALGDAKKGVVREVSRCLRAQYPSLRNPDARARELVLLADGAMLAVFLGNLSRRAAQGITANVIRAGA